MILAMAASNKLSWQFEKNLNILHTWEVKYTNIDVKQKLHDNFNTRKSKSV